MKILIAEDDRMLADALKELLEGHGFQVDAVYDGEMGAEYALLEQMLELAQGDHSQGREEHAALDFGELVRDQVLTYEAVFFEAGLELEGRGEEHLTVSGDGGELRQVVDILLDNARKYASPGGKTVVELPVA